LKIHLNGERFEAADAITVHDLLDQLRVDRDRVAVEHNRSIVKRAEFAQTVLRDGDNVEIVTFVGGG